MCSGLPHTCDSTNALDDISLTRRRRCWPLAKSMHRCSTQQPWRCVATSMQWSQAAS